MAFTEANKLIETCSGENAARDRAMAYAFLGKVHETAARFVPMDVVTFESQRTDGGAIMDWTGWEWQAADSHIEQALKAYQTGISVDSQCRELYFALGQLYERQGNREEAKNQYRAALNVSPGWSEAATALAALEAASLLAVGEGDEEDEAEGQTYADERGAWEWIDGQWQWVWAPGAEWAQWTISEDAAAEDGEERDDDASSPAGPGAPPVTAPSTTTSAAAPIPTAASALKLAAPATGGSGGGGGGSKSSPGALSPSELPTTPSAPADAPKPPTGVPSRRRLSTLALRRQSVGLTSIMINVPGGKDTASPAAGSSEESLELDSGSNAVCVSNTHHIHTGEGTLALKPFAAHGGAYGLVNRLFTATLLVCIRICCCSTPFDPSVCSAWLMFSWLAPALSCATLPVRTKPLET